MSFLMPFFATPPALAQRIHGTVRDLSSERPLPFATAQLLSEDGTVLRTIVADQSGVFTLAAPADGTYRLRAWHVGAETLVVGPIVLEAGADLVLDVLLDVKPIGLEGIDVAVEARIRRLALTGFYERAKIGGGVFLTPEDIAERNPLRTTDLLATVPGLHLEESLSTLHRYPIVRGYRGTGDGLCLPAIYLDGMLLQRGGDRSVEGLRSGGRDVFHVDELHPTGLLGVEVYRSASEVPAQYSGGTAACGVMVFWTR